MSKIATASLSGTGLGDIEANMHNFNLLFRKAKKPT
jgi:hypothetical protein